MLDRWIQYEEQPDASRTRVHHMYPGVKGDTRQGTQQRGRAQAVDCVPIPKRREPFLGGAKLRRLEVRQRVNPSKHPLPTFELVLRTDGDDAPARVRS